LVVGIGGSNLGTIAVQEAVLGKLYNQLNPAIKVLYADTVDTDYINSIIRIIEPALKGGNNIIINCISKSGTTTETAVNFEVLLDVLRKYKRDFEDCVVVTSDKDSELWNLGVEKGFDKLEIPEKVGGRYSVLSAVGLFPLGLLGLDLEELLDGAKSMRDLCISENIEENPAAKSASIQFQHHRRGINIFDLFLFSNDLESLGKWNRQLVAESLGKEYNKKGEKVNNGLTPTVSVGSTDLHSIAQLYLGGPYDKFTMFVSVQNDNSSLNVPKLQDYAEIVAGIRGKSLKTVMDAILEGTKMAFIERKRPFTEIILPDKSEYSMGQFLQFKMIETIYLGYLLDVNPFGQPSVESYKKETRRILSQ
jgi:glucose-6-phosphate isomerase